MKKQFVHICLVLSIISLLTGCASVTGSRNQPVSITTTIEGQPITGANCNLINDKGQWYITTPGSVMIQKSYGDLAINCKKNALSGASVYKSVSEGAVWGNIIAGGLIGYAVDAGSGAGFSYPPTMNVNIINGANAAASLENQKSPPTNTSPAETIAQSDKVNQNVTPSKNSDVQQTSPANQSANHGSAQEWVDKSYQSLQKKEWAEVIRTSSVAISLDPNNADAYANRAWAYCEKGLYDKALEDSNSGIKANPQNAPSVNNRALVHERMQQTDKAISDYRHACELGLDISCQNFKKLVGCLPSEELAFYQKKGTDYFNAGDFDNSITSMDKVLALDPHNAEAFSTNCGAKANKGLLKEAKVDCQKSIEYNPDFSIAYNNLGYVFEKEGSGKEAIIYYEMGCGMGNNLACENQKKLAQNVK